MGAQILGNELVGPAIGAFLFAVGAWLPFFTNASLLAAALVLLAGLPLLEPVALEPPAPGLSTARQPSTRIRDGVRLVVGQPQLVTLTGASATLALVDAAWFGLLVGVIDRTFTLGPLAFGIAMAVGAIGGLAGVAVADRNPQWPLPAVAAVVFGLMSISLVALSLHLQPAMILVVLIVTSGGFALWNVFAVSARQRLTPLAAMGRVGAVYRVVVGLASIVGLLVGGSVAQTVSISATLLVGGAILAVAGLVVARRFHRTVVAEPR